MKTIKPQATPGQPPSDEQCELFGAVDRVRELSERAAALLYAMGDRLNEISKFTEDAVWMATANGLQRIADDVAMDLVNAQKRLQEMLRPVILAKSVAPATPEKVERN